MPMQQTPSNMELLLVIKFTYTSKSTNNLICGEEMKDDEDIDAIVVTNTIIPAVKSVADNYDDSILVVGLTELFAVIYSTVAISVFCFFLFRIFSFFISKLLYLMLILF